ncbi:hypothetical protein PR048_020961 [Dryococelus australis]|uniref:DDE Tnp4 domain-containing protein n=1 Tax=Dryococelus australis TaxID=614101 RepID=A0ABQ9GWZ9_9NEOP|nr:hypothetical protein PR048_020961 [Dryococelus australis]
MQACENENPFAVPALGQCLWMRREEAGTKRSRLSYLMNSRNARAGEQEFSGKTLRPAASSSTIHTCENLGENPPRIEPGSQRQEASALTLRHRLALLIYKCLASYEQRWLIRCGTSGLEIVPDACQLLANGLPAWYLTVNHQWAANEQDAPPSQGLLEIPHTAERFPVESLGATISLRKQCNLKYGHLEWKFASSALIPASFHIQHQSGTDVKAPQVFLNNEPVIPEPSFLPVTDVKAPHVFLNNEPVIPEPSFLPVTDVKAPHVFLNNEPVIPEPSFLPGTDVKAPRVFLNNEPVIPEPSFLPGTDVKAPRVFLNNEPVIPEPSFLPGIDVKAPHVFLNNEPVIPEPSFFPGTDVKAPRVFLNNEPVMREPSFLPGTDVKAPRVFLNNEPVIPEPSFLPGTDVKAPHVFFASKVVRKVVECVFGIVKCKWRLVLKSIECDISDSIVKACCVLHNTILDQEGFKRHLTDVHVLPNIQRPTEDRKKNGPNIPVKAGGAGTGATCLPYQLPLCIPPFANMGTFQTLAGTGQSKPAQSHGDGGGVVPGCDVESLASSSEVSRPQAVQGITKQHECNGEKSPSTKKSAHEHKVRASADELKLCTWPHSVLLKSCDGKITCDTACDSGVMGFPSKSGLYRSHTVLKSPQSVLEQIQLPAAGTAELDKLRKILHVNVLSLNWKAVKVPAVLQFLNIHA